MTFVLQVAADDPEPDAALLTRLTTFPSLQDIAPTELTEIVERFEKLLNNVKKRTTSDPPLLIAVQRTGMPIEILEYFIASLRAHPEIEKAESATQIAWTDGTVRSALEYCSSRDWCKELLNKIDLTQLLNAIQAWRTGIPLSSIESMFILSHASIRGNRIAVGEYLNHKMSVMAQFWGALSVCAEVLGIASPLDQNATSLARAQTFVREGVESVEELEWLRAIGNLDRVLAHILADETSSLRRNLDIRQFVRNQIDSWQAFPDRIPSGLENYRDAIMGVLDELRQV